MLDFSLLKSWIYRNMDCTDNLYDPANLSQYLEVYMRTSYPRLSPLQIMYFSSLCDFAGWGLQGGRGLSSECRC